MNTLAVIAALALCAPAAVQEPAAQPAPDQEHAAQEHALGRRGLLGRLGSVEEDQDSWLSQRSITGDWNGWRAKLEERGVDLAVTFVSDTSRILSGGVRRRTTSRALFDVGLTLDMERLAGLPGTTVFGEFYSQAGRNATEDAGDIQVFSNIDETNVAQLAELWVEHVTADERLRVKVGKLDANSEFALVEAGLGFLQSSAGYSPTVFVLPTYPDPATSVNVFASPADGWTLGLGVYNADEGGAVSGRRGLSARFDETFLVAQVERHWHAPGGGPGGRFAVGAWHHTGDVPRFDAGTESGAEGWFGLVEQTLYDEGNGGGEGLIGFAQWGEADADVSEFERHVGAGLLYRGLVPGHPTWETGLYASHVDLSRAAGLGSSELAIELFQEVPLTPSIVLKPDLQLIVDPAGRDDIGDAWVATVRLELSF